MTHNRRFAPIEPSFMTLTFSIRLIVAVLSIGAIATPSISWAAPAPEVTTEAPPENSDNPVIVFNAARPPSRGMPTGRQRGGAGRDNCKKFESLVALVPETQTANPTATNTKKIVWGQTTAAHPTLWFYLPAPLTADTPVEFTLQDASDRALYTTRIQAAGTPAGIMRVAVPATAPPLAPGTPYTWTLSVYCKLAPDAPNKVETSNFIYVKGSLQRTAAIAPTPATATPLQTAQWYAANGIWYDALTQLAESYQAAPNNRQLATAWASLLQQGGLQSVVAKTFTPCCQAK